MAAASSDPDRCKLTDPCGCASLGTCDACRAWRRLAYRIAARRVLWRLHALLALTWPGGAA